MHFLGLLLLALAKMLNFLIYAYMILLSISVLISWVNPDPYNPIVRFLHQATFPVLRRVRRLIPRRFLATGLDWSPLLVILILILIDTVFVGMLFEWSQLLRSK